MSQIVHIPVDLTLEQLQRACQERGVKVEHRPGRRLLLPVSPECIAEPVDLLCQAGIAETLESWGFRERNGQVELVCGEFDRNHLQENLLDPIRRSVALTRVTKALEEVEQELDQEKVELLIKHPSSGEL